MRTILIITQSGYSKAIAKRFEESGDKVLIEDHLFEGSLFNPEIFKRSIISNPELVIMDSNFSAGQSAKIEYEKMGIPVYGSSLLSRSVTNNPDYLKKILNLNCIHTGVIKQTSVPITYSVVLNSKGRISSCLFFEYYNLMNEDKGPRALMGSIGYYGDISILDERMSSTINDLAKLGFSGIVNFSLNLDDNIVNCSGITFYFSWNTIYNFIENINIPSSELFYALSLNQDIDIKYKSPWSCQINCAVPPFPYNLSKDSETEINGIDFNNRKHLWIMNFNSGELLSATGRGDYIREAKRRAYRTLSFVNATDIMYRTDIGLNVIDVFKKLRDKAWIDIEDSELTESYTVKN